MPEHRRALDEDNPLEIVRLDAQIEERPQPVADLVPLAGLRLGTLRWPPRPGGPGEFGVDRTLRHLLRELLDDRYEPRAVLATMGSLRESIRAAVSV